MPSALSTSRAYSISRRLPSVSGSGMAANRPKRPGLSLRSCAPYSLHARASLRPPRRRRTTRRAAPATARPSPRRPCPCRRATIAASIWAALTARASPSPRHGPAERNDDARRCASSPPPFERPPAPLEAPRPSAAMPPARKLRRAGFAGTAAADSRRKREKPVPQRFLHCRAILRGCALIPALRIFGSDFAATRA